MIFQFPRIQPYVQNLKYPPRTLGFHCALLRFLLYVFVIISFDCFSVNYCFWLVSLVLVLFRYCLSIIFHSSFSVS